ncbi:MAG TPA: PEGA domain-containing protein [Kofleriaceae bacterium]|nr:PEGA domain-containing protein [Kofleriaceae bacterium]
MIPVLAATAATARADRVVAITPLSTLGAEDTSASTRKLLGQLEAAVAALPNTTVVHAAQVSDAIKKAKKPQLRACDGDAACLGELASLVGAQIIISGEVGGLGESKVVYLEAIQDGKELRSTTLAIGNARDPGGGPSGAAIRLLAPDSYRGTIKFALDVTGTSLFVDGSKLTPARGGEIALPVGTHAVRITHPEYHDFVRFIDVEYGKTTDVTVAMQQYPIVRRDLAGKPIDRDKIEYVDPPPWRRWYVVGPAAIGLGIVTAVIVAYASHNFPGGTCHVLSHAGC